MMKSIINYLIVTILFYYILIKLDLVKINDDLEGLL